MGVGGFVVSPYWCSLLSLLCCVFLQHVFYNIMRMSLVLHVGVVGTVGCVQLTSRGCMLCWALCAGAYNLRSASGLNTQKIYYEMEYGTDTECLVQQRTEILQKIPLQQTELVAFREHHTFPFQCCEKNLLEKTGGSTMLWVQKPYNVLVVVWFCCCCCCIFFLLW